VVKVLLPVVAERNRAVINAGSQPTDQPDVRR
jgi:hypothetical protein